MQSIMQLEEGILLLIVSSINDNKMTDFIDRSIAFKKVFIFMKIYALLCLLPSS